MQNEKFGTLLRSAASRLPTSSAIMTRILADDELQPILSKGGTGRPIIVIYGAPGNGKTSTVQALLENYNEIKFTFGLKSVKKTLEGMMEEGGVPVLFLDNFPQPLSAYKLEAGRRILDHVIDVSSEDSEAPITIITGEPNILDEISRAEYLAGRSLIVKMPKIDDDQELYDIRRYFSLHRQEYLEMWGAYDRWAMHNPPDEVKILHELATFRLQFCTKYENRQVGLVFNYYYALRRFSQFLNAKYGEDIPLEVILGNANMLFDWKEESKSSRSSYEIEVWNEFLEDGGISNVLVPNTSVCQRLLDESCYYSNPYYCQGCGEITAVEKYNPMDLRLPEDPTATMLIGNPKLIPDFPRHIFCDTPILMIRHEPLIEMLNTYLEFYSRKHGVSVRRITPKKLTKELFRHNLCLFEYVGIRHNTYTFKMKDRNNEDVRVVFIKLTQKQYRQLNEIAKRSFTIKNYDGRAVRDMNQCVKYFCENVQSLCGDVGMPSIVFDEAVKG